MTPDIAALARGLTEADAEHIKRWDGNYRFSSRLTNLVKQGLLYETRRGIRVVPTKLGLSVRDHILRSRP